MLHARTAAGLISYSNKEISAPRLINCQLNYKTQIKSIRSLLFLLFAIAAQNAVAQPLHAVKDNIACLWGLKNDSGKWVIPPKYTQMENRYGGVFIAAYNEKWGVLSAEGKITVPFEYDNLKPNSYLNGPQDSGFYKIYAVKNGKSGVVDIKGNVKIPFLYDELWKVPYTDLFHIKLNKKLGLRDYEKELLPCKFTTLGNTEYYNLYVAGTSDTASHPYEPFSGKNVGIINLKGDTIIPFRFKAFRIPQRYYPRITTPYKYSTPPLGPLIVAISNEGMGLYTTEGKCLLEPRYNISVPPVNFDADITYRSYDYRDDKNIYSNEPLMFTENGKIGIVFPGKGLIQPAVYESLILQVAPGKRPPVFHVSKNGKQGLLNGDGTELLTCKYEKTLFYSGRVFVSEKEGLIREYNLRKKRFESRTYQKILLDHRSPLKLVSDDSFYTIQNDTVIRQCKVLANLPGDIRILDDYSAIAGKGLTAESILVQRLVNSTINNLVIYSKSGALLCDVEYNVILHSNKYSSFENMYWVPRIIVTTKTGKEGIIDTKGNLVVDTIFENISEYPRYGRLFVKPLTAKRHGPHEYSPKGWAIADSTGQLLTKPDVFMQEYDKYYNTCMFIKTGRGAGVFDFEKGRFIIPPLYKNGFVTGNGDILMQTKDRLFVPFAVDGKKLSPRGWKGLIHISGDTDSQRHTNGFSKKDFPLPIEKKESNSEQHSGHESRQLQDEWLLINGNTLAILSKGELIYNKRAIFDRVYNCFLEADENDVSDYYSNYFGRKSQPYSHDCPRLKTGGVSTGHPYHSTAPTEADPHANFSAKKRDSITVNDSLVMHMIREIAPKARYILHPKKEYDDEDERQEQYHNPSSYYYRAIYRDPGLISLQVLDDYGYHGSSVNKYFFNKSIFKNYRITKRGWKPLKLAQLFKPGYETFLNAEIVIAIQKADSLEMDCNNPASYLQQCNGRFSFSKEGLWLYLEGDNGYEFIPQLIPSQRIRSIIPSDSAAFAFLKSD